MRVVHHEQDSSLPNRNRLRQHVAPSPVPRSQSERQVTTMLLALTAPSGYQSALPSVARTLPEAELVHAALVRKVARGKRVYCPELIGRNEEGQPLDRRHEHAHVLPLDLDGDGHLDHILIHARSGLGAAAQTAIRSLNRTWTKGGVCDLQIAVAGVGDAGQLSTLYGKSHYGKIGRAARRLVGRSDSPSSTTEKTVWQSITPFVLPRFLKRSGKNGLEGQVSAELQSRGLPPAIRVEVLEKESKALRHFVRVRQRGENPPLPPVDMGLALRLEFDRSLPARLLPLALGYASHFGLGLFAMKD
ncbi:MAG: type I-U CRISPR-associated protein Cas5/Cas6, partial [Planctomycetales bacterium]|nr:type I-U CRISPR-associated protein Cas5/Cas6 [Planctomycetales bacterium]